MSVYVKGLSRPEHLNREEIAATDESNNKSQREDPRVLSQAAREHWVRGIVAFPHEKTGDHEDAENQGCEDMSRILRDQPKLKMIVLIHSYVPRSIDNRPTAFPS